MIGPPAPGAPTAALERRPPWGGLFALLVGTFAVTLSLSLLFSASPLIMQDFGVTIEAASWLSLAYALGATVFEPMFGRLGDLHGRKRNVLLGLAAFTLGAALAGLSPVFPLMLAARFVQGLGAAAVIPIGMAFVGEHFPGEMRGRALGLWSMVNASAPAFGPTVGGVLIDLYGWRSIYACSVLLGLVGLTSVALSMPESRRGRKESFDVAGSAALFVAIGSLVTVLTQGNAWGWTSVTTLALLVVSLVAGVTFLQVEARVEHPIVDLALFRNRNYTVATIALSIGYMAFFGNAVLLPLWLQTQMGYTALWAGLASAPIGIFTLILTPIVASNLHRTDLRWIATFAFSVFALTSFWQASFNTDITFGGVALPRLMQGLGMACFFVPMTTISLSHIAHDKVASAAGMTNFVRILGGSFGTSLVITLWGDRISHHRTMLAENISPHNPAWNFIQDKMENAGMGFETALQTVSRIVDRQAVMLATDDVFFLTGIIFLFLIGLTWLSQRVRMPAKK